MADKSLNTITHFLFVSHDANRAGAQLFLLNLMQYLHKKGNRISLLLLGGGALEKELAEVAEVYHYAPKKKRKLGKLFGKPTTKGSTFSDLKKQKFSLAYINTIACAWVAEELKNELQIPIVSHIHELEFSIQLYSTADARKSLFALSDKLIACSNAVGENLTENHNVSFDKVMTVHSFVDNQSINERLSSLNKIEIRTKIGVSEDAFVVSGCGNAEWRKGIDIFIQVANAVQQREPESNIRFVWIGVKHEGDLFEKTVYDLKKMGLYHNVLLLEPTPQAVEIIGSSDVFLLPSREDPFPLVMLEAALAGNPILGFDKTGGCSEFVEANAGAVIPYLVVTKMAEKLLHWQQNQQEAQQLGQNARMKVLETYNFENSVRKIEDILVSFL